MTSHYEQLIARYRRRGVLVDANILLLLAVGTIDRAGIDRFKRTNQYVAEDYDLLVILLNQFSTVATTPNILTEADDLLGRSGYRPGLAVVAAHIAETYVESTRVTVWPDYLQFGLADGAIFDLARDRFLVLTDDLPLYHYLANKHVDVINFNHIRELGWDIE